MADGFVGVHIGAGHHSEARTSLYLSICARACQVATDILRKGGSAIDAAAAATMILEDAGETNAGYGSNLTELGTVEMDAGLMDGDSLLFGAVGAVPGIKNPILVAKLLVQEQRKGIILILMLHSNVDWISPLYALTRHTPSSSPSSDWLRVNGF